MPEVLKCKMYNLTEIFLNVHKELDTIFLCHQMALVSMKQDDSLGLFDSYCSKLFTHIRDEEETLLPFYEKQLIEKKPGGELSLFFREHNKIRQFIAELKHQYMLIDWESGENIKAAVIRLIEQHASYKRLMEHHDIRERNFLYPSLDMAKQEEKDLLVKCCLALPTV